MFFILMFLIVMDYALIDGSKILALLTFFEVFDEWTDFYGE